MPSMVVREGGGETRRNAAIVLTILVTCALISLALPVSAGFATMTCSSETDDPSGDSSKGDCHNEGRKCPNCDCQMRLCQPWTGYKWICHSCGFAIMR